MLKGAIDEYGDQGRADVADLLGRFHKVDAGKAEALRKLLNDDHGEDLPFRVAPLGEGFREPTDEERLALAPKSPFGSPEGADPFAAGTMAETLLKYGDYKHAVDYFRTDKSATMPYLAAVHEQMREKNPMSAMKFATQMQKAGLALPEDKKPIPAQTPAPAPAPAPAPTPPQQPQQPPAPQPAGKPGGDAGGSGETGQPRKDPGSVDVGWKPGAPNAVPAIDPRTGKVGFVDGRTGQPVPGPVMVDNRTGKPVLAPDGKPYHTDGNRTQELLDLSKKMAGQDFTKMSPDELDQWRRDMAHMRAFLGGQSGGESGSGGGQAGNGQQPSTPGTRPNGAPPPGPPRTSARDIVDEIYRLWDKFFTDPKNAPQTTDLPPIDPPPPPPPPPIPTGRRLPRKRLFPRR